MLSSALRILSKTSISDEESDLYAREADELLTIGAAVEAQSGTLIDLLVSILTRVHRVHRTLVFYIIAKMHDVFKADDIRHVVEASDTKRVDA